MDGGFVHLNVHSCYSMMWGVSSVDELCRAAAQAGFEYLALTDTNGVYGLINFLEAARRHGVRPIVGAMLKTDARSAVILAKTPRGYELLCELISRRHLEDRFSLGRSLLDLCAGESAKGEDLALLCSDTGLIKALRDRLECWVEVCAGPSSRKVLAMAAALGARPVATNAVYFAHPRDHELHRMVRAIELNRTLSTLRPEDVVGPERWLKSASQMAPHFPNSPEALSNSFELARRCHTNWDHSRLIFPDYQRSDPFALLLEECRKGILWRYGKTCEAVERRLSEELELIRAKGFIDYFLVVADIVRRRPIHCGRGSGAASLVGYLLGITHVDPIRHNLLFGRFLNPHRKDPPDIDVDFPWDERDELLDEVRRSYGFERTASVSNHVGFAARAAVREVAKVYGIPASEIKDMTARLSHWTHPSRIRERLGTHPRCRGFSLDPPWPEIIEWAARLESLPRHLSVHCGGMIVVPDRISRYVPVERSAKGVGIIQWEKDQTEAAGLVKIDLLGNRSLAVIRDALRAVAKNTGKVLDYPNLNPLEDPETLRLLKEGRTMGVFYVESPAMRQLQQKTGRGDFEHLVIHSSIIRPAANRYIRQYVERLHGVPYEPLHPSLDRVLAETYGLMVYQEDVVRVSMALAGFDWAQADGLRKALGKKGSEQISSYRERFFKGCAGRGIDPDIVKAVWEMIESFAGYSFCKPHSASYALVSFKSAYLKAHYPAEFMAAVLSNEGGYYSTFAYVSEARRMGLTVLGPDINESDWSYTGKNGTVRIGLKQLRSIGKESCRAVLDERGKNGPFRSLDDFLHRVEPGLEDAGVFVKSGALDSLAEGLNRPQLLWAVEAHLRKAGKSRFSGERTALRGFFRPEEGRVATQITAVYRSQAARAPAPPLPDYSSSRKWEQEAQSLGFVLSVHPLELFEPSIRKLACPPLPAVQLTRHVGRRVRVLGWPITRKEVLTKEGEPMEFVSFEDRSAIYEAVFFPKIFRRFCLELDKDHPYLLSGMVESEFGAVSLTVERLIRIESSASRPFLEPFG